MRDDTEINLKIRSRHIAPVRASVHPQMSAHATYKGIHLLIEAHPATVAKFLRTAKAHLCRGFREHSSLDWRRQKKLQWVSVFFTETAAAYLAGFHFFARSAGFYRPVIDLMNGAGPLVCDHPVTTHYANSRHDFAGCFRTQRDQACSSQTFCRSISKVWWMP